MYCQNVNASHSPGNDIAIDSYAHHGAVGTVKIPTEMFVAFGMKFFTVFMLCGAHHYCPAQAADGKTSGKIGWLRRAVVHHERNIGVLKHVMVLAGKARSSDEYLP